MSNKVLVREALCLSKKQSDKDELFDFADLADEAKKLLGYDTLAGSITAAKVAEEHAMPLRQTLVEIGIKPFTAQSVADYKEKIEWKCKLPRERIGEILCLIFGITFFLSVTSLAGSGILALCWILSVIPNWISVLACWSGFVGFVGFVGVIVSFFVSGDKETKVRWESIPIVNYRKPIPEFALQTAVDIKKRCPTAEFFVEEMLVDTVSRPDPFLIVQLGSGRYYLEVWNEPGFKKVREV